MLARWLLYSEWRLFPLRCLIAVCAIALGVALGYAIDLINSASVAEFSGALKSLAGDSDLQVRGSNDYFDESIYPLLARHPDLANVRPMLDLRLLPSQSSNTNNTATPAPTSERLQLIGIDSLRSSPGDLQGLPLAGQIEDIFAADTVFLSTAAQSWLQVKPGQTLYLSGKTLRVAGSVANARSGQRIAVMDIASAQWQFGRLGQLSRIEVKARAGLDLPKLQQSLQALLQPHGAFQVAPLQQQEQKARNMSSAYRINLNMLALVALMTGAFLIFSNQALSVLRRRSQFALLHVLGWTRQQLLQHLLLEGVLLGLLGALLGLALGFALAQLGLSLLGGDLGAGYFTGVTPKASFDLWRALGFALLGTLVALAGSALPAWQAAQNPAAHNLKGNTPGPRARPWLALLALALAAMLSQLPALGELPLFAYGAIFLLLIASIALTPHLGSWLFGLALRRWHRQAVLTLALARLTNQPDQAGVALGGLLASFSLMVAMAIMVNSFRFSVDQWLLQVLPAQVYLRSLDRPLDQQQQQQVRQLPGIGQIEFIRYQNLTLDPAQAPLALLARQPALEVMQARFQGRRQPDSIEVWISEAVLDLYHWQLGQVLELPIAGKLQRCQVMGIWRDYARQFGAIIIQPQDYQRLSGDRTANDAAIWLQAGASAANMRQQLQQLPFASQLGITEAGQIRELSLRIFDRSFAITYVLELVAILIGLFGVASSFSAQTLARIREFGMLRHLGYQKSQIMALLGLEAAMLGLLGIALGALVGWLISLILVFIINPQSFHWRMQMHLPWLWLLSSALLLWLAASISALLAGRQAISGPALLAVRSE